MSLVAGVAVAFLLLAALRWWWRRRQPLSDTMLSKDRRRSYRIALTTPVFVYGWIADEPFSESTETLDVSGNGGLIRLSGTVIPSQELILTNLQTDEVLTCRVARTARTNEGTILAGLHFLQASPTFWRVDFVSSRRNTEIPTSPDQSSPKKVAGKLFILQGSAKPLSSAPVWAEPSQLLLGMWTRVTAVNWHPS
jgi:hypothetical protein